LPHQADGRLPTDASFSRASRAKVAFGPSDFITYARGVRALSKDAYTIPDDLIYSTSPRVVAELVSRVGAVEVSDWMYGTRYPLYVSPHRPVAVAQVRVGGPGAVMQLEELIACGARRLIGIGFVGGIQPQMEIGDVVVPLNCIRSDGVSYHYASDSDAAKPDSALAQTLAQHCGGRTGTVWSTDAPYRELWSSIEKCRQAGVLGVDMECAGVFAMAAFRSVVTATVLMVHNLIFDRWTPGLHSDLLESSMARVIDGILMVINRSKERNER